MIGTAELYQRFLESSGACTDTRQLLKGGIFFALKGPNFNANEIAANALEQGCKCAVVDDATVAMDERFLLVTDVLRSLQDLSRYHRRRFHIPVIAITGTNGKTTTKELGHAVLSAHAPTLATIGNLNNHIGVPLTLLRLNSNHQFAIIEMGANHIGDIAELAAIAEPTHGLITNIGRAHLEGFGSYEGVITAKTELYDFLKRGDGCVFVNADDPLLMSKSEGLTRVTYSTADVASLNGGLVPSTDPYLHCWISRGNERSTVDTHLIGAYNLPNVLAAACMGSHFHVALDRIITSLSAYEPSNNRSQFKNTGRNHLILDAYNANPSSVQVALRNFAAMASDRPKLVVLGDMLELGTDSAAEHKAIMALLTELEMKAWLVGPEYDKSGNGTGHLRFRTSADALIHAQHAPPMGQLILIKGSRGIKLETIVPAL